MPSHGKKKRARKHKSKHVSPLNREEEDLVSRASKSLSLGDDEPPLSAERRSTDEDSTSTESDSDVGDSVSAAALPQGAGRPSGKRAARPASEDEESTTATESDSESGSSSETSSESEDEPEKKSGHSRGKHSKASSQTGKMQTAQPGKKRTPKKALAAPPPPPAETVRKHRAKGGSSGKAGSSAKPGGKAEKPAGSSKQPPGKGDKQSSKDKTDKKEYACVACKKEYSDASGLRRHWGYCQLHQLYQCPAVGCSYFGKRQADLMEHFRGKHAENLPKPRRWDTLVNLGHCTVVTKSLGTPNESVAIEPGMAGFEKSDSRRQMCAAALGRNAVPIDLAMDTVFQRYPHVRQMVRDSALGVAFWPDPEEDKQSDASSQSSVASRGRTPHRTTSSRKRERTQSLADSDDQSREGSSKRQASKKAKPSGGKAPSEAGSSASSTPSKKPSHITDEDLRVGQKCISLLRKDEPLEPEAMRCYVRLVSDDWGKAWAKRKGDPNFATTSIAMPPPKAPARSTVMDQSHPSSKPDPELDWSEEKTGKSRKSGKAKASHTSGAARSDKTSQQAQATASQQPESARPEKVSQAKTSASGAQAPPASGADSVPDPASRAQDRDPSNVWNPPGRPVNVQSLRRWIFKMVLPLNGTERAHVTSLLGPYDDDMSHAREALQRLRNIYHARDLTLTGEYAALFTPLPEGIGPFAKVIPKTLGPVKPSGEFYSHAEQVANQPAWWEVEPTSAASQPSRSHKPAAQSKPSAEGGGTEPMEHDGEAASQPPPTVTPAQPRAGARPKVQGKTPASSSPPASGKKPKPKGAPQPQRTPEDRAQDYGPNFRSTLVPGSTGEILPGAQDFRVNEYADLKFKGDATEAYRQRNSSGQSSAPAQTPQVPRESEADREPISPAHVPEGSHMPAAPPVTENQLAAPPAAAAAPAAAAPGMAAPVGDPAASVRQGPGVTAVHTHAGGIPTPFLGPPPGHFGPDVAYFLGRMVQMRAPRIEFGGPIRIPGPALVSIVTMSEPEPVGSPRVGIPREFVFLADKPFDIEGTLVSVPAHPVYAQEMQALLDHMTRWQAPGAGGAQWAPAPPSPRPPPGSASEPGPSQSQPPPPPPSSGSGLGGTQTSTEGVESGPVEGPDSRVEASAVKSPGSGGGTPDQQPSETTAEAKADTEEDREEDGEQLGAEQLLGPFKPEEMESSSPVTQAEAQMFVPDVITGDVDQEMEELCSLVESDPASFLDPQDLRVVQQNVGGVGSAQVEVTVDVRPAPPLPDERGASYIPSGYGGGSANQAAESGSTTQSGE